MITYPGRVRRAVIVAGAAIAATALSVSFATPAASAQTAAAAHGKHSSAAGGQSAPSAQGKRKAAGGTRNGDNGDVKIHNSATAVTDERNEPHVCVFYLDAFDFDSGQSVSWQIKSWPPTGSRSVVKSGALVLDSDGTGHTGDMSLQNGHYKLFWNFAGEKGFAKQKVFWVRCPGPTPSHGHKGKKKKVPPVPGAPAPKPVRSSLPVTG
jgi:hypothetical protein